MPTRLQDVRPLWRLHRATAVLLMTLDIRPQNASSRTISMTDIGNQRLPDSIWSLEKHTVQTQMIPGQCPPLTR
jgi:hypothetical protein